MAEKNGGRINHGSAEDCPWTVGASGYVTASEVGPGGRRGISTEDSTDVPILRGRGSRAGLPEG